MRYSKQYSTPKVSVPARLQGDWGRRVLFAIFLSPACVAALVRVGVAEDPTRQPPIRARLDLNGRWEFRMDPDDQGISEQWFSADASYPDKITVPGCWQAQGFGEPREFLRHDYQGKAWYRRIVTVPADWKGRRIWVHIGGAANTADVYVNGKKVGRVEEFLTPWEFDATDAIKPGEKNVVACRVDSTGPAPIGMFNFTGRWGGLTREVFLEARRDPQIDDLFVIPDVKNKTARVRVALRRHAAGSAWEGRLKATIRPATGGDAVRGTGAVHFTAGAVESEPTTIDVAIPEMRCWSPEDPFLYCVDVSLSHDGAVIDACRDRFGMRQMESDANGTLLLNGKPYFIRGLGDDSVEVISGIPMPDKQIYINRLKMAKRYGFNGIRFLSHVPNKEYFDAADEVGMLLLCDGELYGHIDHPVEILKMQVTRVAKAHRNHPSWYAFSSGNELFRCEGPTPDQKFMDYILYAHKTFKSLDPTRFFIASEGTDVFPTDIITKRTVFAAAPKSPSQTFDGSIDEIAYFPRALDDAQMGELSRRIGAEAYSRTVQAMRPSGYWRLEETSPGRAADSSGNGRHGVYDSKMTADHLGKPGSLDSVSRDSGSRGRAMRVAPGRRGVHLTDVASEVFASGNRPFSVSLFVKPDGFSKGDFGTPFAYGAPRPKAAFIIAEDGVGGEGLLRLGRFGEDFLISSKSMRTGDWNHIGITYDGSRLKLFLDGKPAGTAEVKLTTAAKDGRIGGIATPEDTDFDTLSEKIASRPHIWHEFPNTYVGPLPDLTIMDKWTGIFQDYHLISYHRKQIADLGVTEAYPNARRRSVDLFYLYLKNQYEKARHSTTMDGYNYWCFTDFPGGPEGDMTTYGIFSTVYEPEKFPDPEPILRFNRETVLLCNAGTHARVLEPGNPREIVVSISHYGGRPIRDGRLTWTATAGDRVLQQGSVENIGAETGQVKPIAAVTLGPFDLEEAARVRLNVALQSDTCRQENGWDFWIFPAKRPGFDPKGVVKRTSVDAFNARYGIAPDASLDTARLVLADRVTPEVLDYLREGGRVLLCTEKGGLVRSQGFSFWPQWIRSTGTVIEDHPALQGFPHEGFCAYQFIRLFHSNAMVLGEKGSVEREKLTPIIWGLSQDPDTRKGTQWSNALNRWKINRHGLLCEGRVGKGRLLVCHLKVLQGVENGLPEAGYLLDTLVDYALSEEFAPDSTPMTVEEFRKVFVAEGP